MRRVLVICATVLSLLSVSCGGESITAGGEPLSTPVPAPTVAGVDVEFEQPEIQVETVLIGVSSTDTIMLHALPGIDKPLAGDVPPGTSIEPMGQAFETEDGLLWWQVRAGNLQGWIEPNVAYRGPVQNITNDIIGSLGDQGPFESPEESAQAVAEQFASDQGQNDAEIIIVSTTTLQNTPSATVTVDILINGDDSVRGTRLIIASGETSAWQPESVFQAALCARGVSADGLCL